VVGVIMPPIMLLADPVVFRGGTIVGRALLGQYRTSCYVGIALAILAMVMVLKTSRARAFFAGIMAAASIFGVILGLAILPFSLIGMILMGLGLLGLSPFLAAVVFAWWSRRAFRESNAGHRWLHSAAGAVVFLGVCLGTQAATAHVLRSSLEDIASSRLRKQRAATERLARWQLLVDMDAFILAWQQHSDPEAKRRLAEAYKTITGEDLEERASRLVD